VSGSRISRIVVVALATLAGTTLASCGGGDGTAPTQQPPPTARTAATLEATGTTATSATVASAMTVGVVARDAAGAPVPDVAVSFGITAGNGSVASTTVRTNASGVATTTWTLGITAGGNALVASVATVGQGVTFTAAGMPGPAVSLGIASGDAQMGQTSSPLPEPLRVQVTDAHGNAITGASSSVAVSFAVASGGGTIAGVPVAIDAAGVASAAWTLGAATGAQSVTASFGGTTVTFRATADPNAALVILPSLGASSDARSINDAGTVIAGYSQEPSGRMVPVRWTWSSATGRWTIAPLAFTGDALAVGVDAAGYVAGYAADQSAALLWTPAGQATVVSCSGDVGRSQVANMSGGGQLVIGVKTGESPLRAAVWRAGQCRELLPSLGAGGGGVAYAGDGSGTIVVGTSALDADLNVGGRPVRWTLVAGQWQVQQLDARQGRAFGVNAAGDIAGQSSGACGSTLDCPTTLVWYAGGSSRDLGALGGEGSWARDINATGELAGVRRTGGDGGKGYFWSEALGVRALPDLGRPAAAWSMSNVRADGTRLVVGGMNPASGTSGFLAVVWVIRNP
jgi:hypothetical protein